jgi:hypothetical protein
MRAKLAEHLAHGGAGLNPIALKAAERACKSEPKPFPPPADAQVRGG